MLLQIKNLTLSFRNGTRAVEDLTLTVNRGEIVAVVGESGSGKSVTALSVLRLLLPSSAQYESGQILFSAKGGAATDLLLSDHVALQLIRGHRIGMVFQEPMTSLNPVFTCGNQLSETLRQHLSLGKVAARKRALELFEKVRLPDPPTVYDKYPHQLSGGQRQRVMIAMAVSCNPALLLCDEPTTALDPSVQQSILELIKSLQHETGMGVLFITHDLGLVEGFADRVVVMYRGRVVEEGTTRKVLHTPVHPYTKGLLQCRPVLHKKGERLRVLGVGSEQWAVGSEQFTVGSGQLAVGSEQPEDSSAQVSVGSDNSVLPTANCILPTTNFLEVRNLTVRYIRSKGLFGRKKEVFTAVDGVSFSMARGEVVGLTGESGCGKTTLGRALLGLLEHVEGQVTLNGMELPLKPGKAGKSLRKALQLVFQDPYSSLNPQITLGSAIGEPLRVHGLYPESKARRGRVLELLNWVGLPAEFYDRHPHACSGGQRQRAVIARALALEPQLLVCDESVAALDVSVQAQVINLLSDLRRQLGLSMLFISHDHDLVRYFCDRVFRMEAGRVLNVPMY